MRIFVHDGDSLYNFHIMFSSVSKFIKATLNPAIYHGQVLSSPFFEGWYFKAVDATGQYRYAFIPGVFVGKTAQDSHAFVQVLEGASSKVAYHRFPIKQFWSAEDGFKIRIAENYFSLDKIELNITSADQQVRGVLNFIEPKGWPVQQTSPSVMGWYAWVPRMECYHVVSWDLITQLRESYTLMITCWISQVVKVILKKIGVKHSPRHGSGCSPIIFLNRMFV